MEGGAASGSAFYEAPEPAPRRATPEAAPAMTVRPPVPAQASAPAPGTTTAVREVLAKGGAPEALAGQVAAALGEGAAQVLLDDPWQLLAVSGVRPEQADGFARALLGAACGPEDPRRTVALTVWLLERAALQGHTALEIDTVRTGLAGHAVPDPGSAVEEAVSAGAVLVFQEEETAEEEPEEDEESPEVPEAAADVRPRPYCSASTGTRSRRRASRTASPGSSGRRLPTPGRAPSSNGPPGRTASSSTRAARPPRRSRRPSPRPRASAGCAP